MMISNGLKYRREPYVILVRIGTLDFWICKPTWLREFLFDSDYIQPASAPIREIRVIRG